jgi:hypothetical protein
MAFFFHSGPLSWQGILVFWLALTTYSVFLIGMGLVLRRAVLRLGGDLASAHAAA